MPQIGEVGEATQLIGALRQGLDSLSLDESVDFETYTKTILPLDGYVFWKPASTLTVEGSLHYSQEIQQSETETVGFATVVFTSKDEIMQLSQADQRTLYVATVEDFRYAFRQQNGFYTTAGLWHYVGHSIYPALSSQLLDPGNTIDLNRAVVSNSLPFWLDLNNYAPIYGGLFNNVTLYPSYVVEENIAPPYVAVHISPETEAIQGVPLRGPFGAHTQLVSDRVRLTLYGFQSNESLDFLDGINQYSLDTDNFGIMSTEVVRDDKRIQEELQALGMKKTIELRVSYYQSRSVAVALQLIESCAPAFYAGSI